MITTTHSFRFKCNTAPTRWSFAYFHQKRQSTIRLSKYESYRLHFCNFSMNQDTVRQSEHHTLHWDNIPAKIEKISSFYNAVYSFLCLLAHACVFQNQRDTALIYVNDDLHKLCTRCVWNSSDVAALGFH